jgi:hypothetical protein
MKQAARRGRLKVGLGILLFAGMLAVLPMTLGLGPFGYKLFRYDRVTMYVANGTDWEITVSVGNSSNQLPRMEVASFDFLAGEDLHLTTRTEDGELLEELVFSTDNQDVFYNVDGALCFAMMNVSRLYHEQHQENPVEMIRGIDSDDRFVLIPEGVFIRPRGVAPSTVPGGHQVTWIDDVACLLLDPGNEHLLLQQQLIEMQGRRDRREAMIEEQRRNAN